MKKVVSFSLWGDSPKYCVGALRNAELVKKMYPGWEARFYVGTSVPQDIVSGLKERDANIIDAGVPGDWRGMFWRFEPASDSDVEMMVSRDCDSRITSREVAAVTQWLKSDFLFHIMRDHPAHETHILGGMWGVKAPLLRDMKSLINDYVKGDFWQVDQNFLREIIYPRVFKMSIVHDPFFEKKPFPTARKNYEFVGDVFDENEVRHSEYWKNIQTNPGIEAQ